jgi:hypothetical protein
MANFPKIRLTLACLALAAITTSTTLAQQPEPQKITEIVVRGRVLDAADSVPLFRVVVFFEPGRGMPYVLSDSLGRFLYRGAASAKNLRVFVHNGFYLSDSLITEIPSKGAIDIGTVLLRRGPYPEERMIIPLCERIDSIPKPLPTGTWIQHGSGWSATRELVLCDGYLHEPRVTQRPNTR